MYIQFSSFAMSKWMIWGSWSRRPHLMVRLSRKLLSQNLQLASWRLKRPHGMFLVQVQVQRRKRPMLQFKEGQAGMVNSSLITFSSLQSFNELVEAYTHQGGQSTLLGLPTQILIFSRNTFTDTLRTIFNQMSYYPVVL